LGLHRVSIFSSFLTLPPRSKLPGFAPKVWVTERWGIRNGFGLVRSSVFSSFPSVAPAQQTSGLRPESLRRRRDGGTKKDGRKKIQRNIAEVLAHICRRNYNASGIGHRASGIGHRASGFGLRASGFGLRRMNLDWFVIPSTYRPRRPPRTNFRRSATKVWIAGETGKRKKAEKKNKKIRRMLLRKNAGIIRIIRVHGIHFKTQSPSG